MNQHRMDPEQYYDEFGTGEWKRLDENPVTRFEFENTISTLEQHLPSAGRVLDAGGGPGRYAIWLAERGFDVELLDLSREQVRIARKKAEEHGVANRINCQKGDVRDLPFEDDEFDAVACLGGPISHILNEEERSIAVAELGRVARTDAPVFVSVIGRLAALQQGMRHALDVHPHLLLKVAESGDYTRELLDEVREEDWAECHFFRVDELKALLESEGLTVEQIIGLEGVASAMQPELRGSSDEAIEAVQQVVDQLKFDRTVADLSEHILTVSRT